MQLLDWIQAQRGQTAQRGTAGPVTLTESSLIP